MTVANHALMIWYLFCNMYLQVGFVSEFKRTDHEKYTCMRLSGEDVSLPGEIFCLGKK